jgi:hypothetical protein
MKKRDQTASVYFNKIKALADTLSSIGEPLRDSEFTGFVIAGLDVEYDSLVEVVANAGGMSPKELYNHLLSTEQRVESRRAVDVYGESSTMRPLAVVAAIALLPRALCQPRLVAGVLLLHRHPSSSISSTLPPPPTTTLGGGRALHASSAALLATCPLEATSASAMIFWVLAMTVMVTSVRLPWLLKDILSPSLLTPRGTLTLVPQIT